MRTLALIIFFPFILLKRIADAFKAGAKGYVYCINCNKLVHVHKALRGTCSAECFIEQYKEVSDVKALLGLPIQEHAPEWKTLHNPDSSRNIDLTVFLDQDGLIFLSDFSDSDDPHLKPVGNDGYAL